MRSDITVAELANQLENLSGQFGVDMAPTSVIRTGTRFASAVMKKCEADV